MNVIHPSYSAVQGELSASMTAGKELGQQLHDVRDELAEAVSAGKQLEQQLQDAQIEGAAAASLSERLRHELQEVRQELTSARSRAMECDAVIQEQRTRLAASDGRSAAVLGEATRLTQHLAAVERVGERDAAELAALQLARERLQVAAERPRQSDLMGGRVFCNASSTSVDSGPPCAPLSGPILECAVPPVNFVYGTVRLATLGATDPAACPLPAT